MKTRHAPFSLYKKRFGTRFYWYARFWDDRERKYSIHRATGIEAAGKKERRDEAVKQANDILPSICFNVSNMSMLQYLKAFWTEDSPYFRESEKVYKRRLSAYYAKSHQDTVRLYIEKYKPFNGIGIEKVTPGLVRDFMLWMAEQGASGSRINRVLQTVRVPLRYAIERDEVRVDPFTKVKPAHEEHREKGVLTRKEVLLLLNSPITDLKKRLAVLLGMLCGMRLGEVRGLHWEDIDSAEGVIRIRHNWQDMEGVKVPKCESTRAVPLPRAVECIGKKYQQAQGMPKAGLIFVRPDGKPPCNGYFRLALIRELEGIGIPGPWKGKGKQPEGYMNEQQRQNISFHSLRHTFVSISRLAGLNDFQTRALTGHRSIQMLERYSHAVQVVEVDACKGVLEGFISTGKKMSFF
jgi:integrase